MTLTAESLLDLSFNLSASLISSYYLERRTSNKFIFIYYCTSGTLTITKTKHSVPYKDLHFNKTQILCPVRFCFLASITSPLILFSFLSIILKCCSLTYSDFLYDKKSLCVRLLVFQLSFLLYVI